jgi:hypothetical protein
VGRARRHPSKEQHLRSAVIRQIGWVQLRFVNSGRVVPIRPFGLRDADAFGSVSTLWGEVKFRPRNARVSVKWRTKMKHKLFLTSIVLALFSVAAPWSLPREA